MDPERSHMAQGHTRKTSFFRRDDTERKRSSASASPHEKENEKRTMKRGRSPPRYSRPFTRGRYFRPRYYFRARDEGFFRRPAFGLRFQRFHRASGFRSAVRSRSPSQLLRRKVVKAASPACSQYSDKKSEKNTPTPVREHQESFTPERSPSSSVDSERKSMSFTVTQVTQEPQISCSGEVPSSITRAAARNRAIQKKRKEIEEVYQQDCDTFGVVVKMLVAKDPSLERPIQTSLRENLRDIGLRCVEAMEQFIHEYDSRDSSTLSPDLPH